jgi:hypothetical protein
MIRTLGLIEEKSNAYRILIGKSEREKLLEK